MKKLILLFLSIGSFLLINAQAVFNENFSYTAGDSVTQTVNDWSIIGTVYTNPVKAIAPGLTYSGYPNTGIGNAVNLVTSGQDIYKDASSSISSGNVYVSFMMNVSSAQATGDYFLALLPTTSTSTFFARTFIKSSGAGFVMGVSKWTEAAIYSANVLSFNTTYLVVLKYNFSTATTTDDQATLYVFSSGIPVTEPVTTEVGPTAGTAADAASIGRIALRQGSAANAAALKVDGIRMASTWANSPLPVQIKSFTASNSGDGNMLKWTTASEVNNNYFEVLLSTNGARFLPIGIVKGAGNSNSVKYYSFNDVHPESGNVCYKLRQVDYNGNSNFSRTSCVLVEAEHITKIESTPNPFNSELGIQINYAPADVAHVTLVDLIGKTHYSGTKQVNHTTEKITINTQDIPNGIYFVRVVCGSQIFTQKVIKK